VIVTGVKLGLPVSVDVCVRVEEGLPVDAPLDVDDCDAVVVWLTVGVSVPVWLRVDVCEALRSLATRITRRPTLALGAGLT